MGKRILILDDDSDFNNLLTDIYSQADYDVVSEHDPEDAVLRFRDEDFDLVVTDQKMPGLSGEEFIREIKGMKPKVPVIMVSGYLDNDTIRSLIREGVGGVFLKPLNVFSLLKRTSALIEEAEMNRGGQGREPLKEDRDPTDYRHSLPFDFECYPCRAAKSQEFAKKLFASRAFKHNLVLIGEEGTDLASIVHDLAQFDNRKEDAYKLIDHSQLTEAKLMERVEAAAKDAATTLTLVVPRTELIGEDAQQVLFAAGRGRGAFENLPIALRFIFLVHDDIDVLYDERKIDDDLYMFLGTTEVKVPALREVRDDIPIMAQRAINAEISRQGSKRSIRLNPAARSFLKERDWRGGVLELKRVARAIAHLDKEGDVTHEDVELATRHAGSGQGNQDKDLRRMLTLKRNDYALAVALLCEGDPVRTNQILEADDTLLERFLITTTDAVK